MDPITTLIIASLAGVCVIQMHIFYTNNNDNPKKYTNQTKPKKTIYTSEEEDIYLADDGDGPIWF